MVYQGNHGAPAEQSVCGASRFPRMVARRSNEVAMEQERLLDGARLVSLEEVRRLGSLLGILLSAVCGRRLETGMQQNQVSVSAPAIVLDFLVPVSKAPRTVDCAPGFQKAETSSSAENTSARLMVEQ